jgi:uncharacterized protein
MKWLNEPASWQRTGDVLSVSVDPGTDFWRETGYGYIHDNGHVYGEVHEGDVDVSVCVRGAFGSQYDQAGIMLRIEERVWLKTGVEFFEGRPRLSTVLTLGRSSWIVTDLPEWMEEITLRASRRGDAVEVRYLVEGGTPELAALVYLPQGREVLAGIMCAAPEGPGFRVSFSDLSIERGWSARLAKMAAERREEEAAEQRDERAAEERDEAVTGERDGPASDWRGETGTQQLPGPAADWRSDNAEQLPEPADWREDTAEQLSEPVAEWGDDTADWRADTAQQPAEPGADWRADTEGQQTERAGDWGDGQPAEPAEERRGDRPAGAGEPAGTDALGWVAAPVSETEPHWHDEPARTIVSEWSLTLPGSPASQWPGSVSQGNGSSWLGGDGPDQDARWFGDSGDAAETRWFGKIPAEAGQADPAGFAATGPRAWVPDITDADAEVEDAARAEDAAAGASAGDAASAGTGAEDAAAAGTGSEGAAAGTGTEGAAAGTGAEGAAAGTGAEDAAAAGTGAEGAAAGTSGQDAEGTGGQDAETVWEPGPGEGLSRFWSTGTSYGEPAAPDAEPEDEPAQTTGSEPGDGLEPLPPAETPRAEQPRARTEQPRAPEGPDLSRESSDDTTLKWLAELRDDSDPLWADEPGESSGPPRTEEPGESSGPLWPKESSHPSGPIWRPATDDAPPAWSARTPTEGHEWPKSRPKDAVTEWDRLVAGSRAGTWVPTATPDVGDRWPGPPLLDIAAREREIPEPRPTPPVEAPRSWSQPEGLGNHTSTGEDGTEASHGPGEGTARRNPPHIDLPQPPDPADEWISLLTADPAEE